MTYNAKVVLEQGASVLRVDSGGSVKYQAGGALYLGDSQFLFGTITDPPTVTASPGDLFLRNDGSAGGLYVNTSDGNSGSVWSSACLNAP